ncbi:hypothetical protein ILYODFUR_027451 [Ilyodon furcidens]|uniref:Uncharacterized protein n=1 Tax=Ilyodon furcidens TaxID=33524 RepID=A0ABV0UAN8_9TELE
MHQLGNQAGQANCSRPSTSHQLPHCGHKTCSTPPPTWPPTVALHLGRVKSHRRRKAITARQGQGTPSTPHPNPGGTPGCRPLTDLHSTPHCTKQADQPLHQSEATSQSNLHIARPRRPCRKTTHPQSTDRAPKSVAEIQGNPNNS